MRRWIFVLIAALCSLPALAVQVPTDTEETIFGIGYGEVSSEAERDALAQIALRLSARVSVEEKSLLSSQNGHAETAFSSASTITTDELLMPSYTLVERHEYQGQQQIVIAVERADIASLYQLEASNGLNQVAINQAQSRTGSAFRALSQALVNDSLLQQSQSLIRVLIGLDIEAEQTDTLVAQYQQLMAAHRQSIQLLSLNVTGDTRSQLAIEALNDNASMLGITADHQAPLQIVLRSREKQASSSGKVIAARKITVDIREQGQLESVMQRDLDFMSEPKNSKYEASAFIDDKIRSSLLSNGLVKIIGIKNNEN